MLTLVAWNLPKQEYLLHGNQQTLYVRSEVSGLLNIYHHPINNSYNSKTTSRTGSKSEAQRQDNKVSPETEDTSGQRGLNHWSIERWHQIQVGQSKIRSKKNPRPWSGDAAPVVGLTSKCWRSVGQGKCHLLQKHCPQVGVVAPDSGHILTFL